MLRPLSVPITAAEVKITSVRPRNLGKLHLRTLPVCWWSRSFQSLKCPAPGSSGRIRRLVSPLHCHNRGGAAPSPVLAVVLCHTRYTLGWSPGTRCHYERRDVSLRGHLQEELCR